MDEEQLPLSAKNMLNLLGEQAEKDPLLSLIDKQQKEISELKEEIKQLKENQEKLKPFIQLFNENFGTNLTIGSNEVNGTFGKYRLVKGI